MNECPELKLQGQFDSAVFDKVLPHLDSPMAGVTWHVAAAFCNWYSRKTGIPDNQHWYTIEVVQDVIEVKGAKVVIHRVVAKEKPAFEPLTGYRLPTIDEWTYACRNGATTIRYFGNTTEFLERYARYLPNGRNRHSRVAEHVPNSLGMFDMLGSVWEWSQSFPAGYSEELEANDDSPRCLCGSSVGNADFDTRISNVMVDQSVARSSNYGFRMIRTFVSKSASE